MESGELSPEALYLLFSKSGKLVPNLMCTTIVESQRNYSNGVFTLFDGRYRYDRSLSKENPEERDSTAKTFMRFIRTDISCWLQAQGRFRHTMHPS